MLACVNLEDEPKFMVEIQQYYRFLQKHLLNPNWDAVSEGAKKGNPQFNTRMALLYLNEHQLNLAFDSAMVGALGGDPEALAILGLLEVEKKTDSGLSINLFKCAAERGDSLGLCHLAIAYINGLGVERNDSRALKLFERSALQGDAIAQYHVGTMYLNGIGCEADSERGLYWLYMSSRHGMALAVNTIWQYYKAINDLDNYVDIVRKGAQQGIEECVQELELIRVSSNRNTNPTLNYDVTVNNPAPVYDTTADMDACPVCGKHIALGTTVCPHCKEIIWEE